MRTGKMIAVTIVGLTLAFGAPPAKADMIYWANINGWPNRIQRANSDGSNQTPEDVALRTSLDGDVAVDSIGGKVYWPENNVILRANLDGSNVETVATLSGVGRPAGIDIGVIPEPATLSLLGLGGLGLMARRKRK